VIEEFSFAQNEIDFISGKVWQLMPSLSKMISISANEGKKIEILLHEKDEISNFEKGSDDSVIKKILSYGNSGYHYLWQSPEELPFSIENAQIVQFDAFAETRKNVLIINLRYIQKSPLLLFLYFNEDSSNFMLSMNKNSMTTETKEIIGTLCYNALKSALDNYYKDIHCMKKFRTGVNEVIRSLESAKDVINEHTTKHENVVLSYAMEVLNEIYGKTNGYNFEFSTKALDKIKDYAGDFSTLKNSLISAASFVLGMNASNKYSTLLIEDYHISFPKITVEKETAKVTKPNSRREKTIQLLDNLEEAARKAMDKDPAKITSEKLCETYYKKITPPGISDALKTHSNLLPALLKEFPDRWPIIRNDFKPLINIVLRVNKSEEKKQV
jgi:hypothetical protein